MTNTHDVVADLGTAIAQRIGERSFALWFKEKTKFNCTVDGLTVGTGNLFQLEWLSSRYDQDIRRAAGELLGAAVDVRWVVDPELFQAQRKEEPQPVCAPASPPKPASRGRRYMSLDEFVIGPCNRTAYLAALTTAETGPESAPNPIVIHGPCGTGKTHILEGIYQTMAQSRSVKQIEYLSSEEFTNRFLQALRTNKQASFRREMRQCDALLVDDVQFFAGKTATQVEFLHTIEALNRLGHPVVCTCDSPPRFLGGFIAPLVNRLQSGSPWGITFPDYAVRREIVNRRGLRLGFSLPEDVSDFLSENFRSDVRELHGALHSVLHYHQAYGRPITLELARDATRDLLHHTNRVVQLREIERAVCRTIQIEGRLLHGKDRSRFAVRCRDWAMYAARKHTHSSVKEIGRFFGDRAHSSVLAACGRVQILLDGNAGLQLGERYWTAQELCERIRIELES